MKKHRRTKLSLYIDLHSRDDFVFKRKSQEDFVFESQQKQDDAGRLSFTKISKRLARLNETLPFTRVNETALLMSYIPVLPQPLITIN